MAAAKKAKMNDEQRNVEKTAKMNAAKKLQDDDEMKVTDQDEMKLQDDDAMTLKDDDELKLKDDDEMKRKDADAMKLQDNDEMNLKDDDEMKVTEKDAMKLQDDDEMKLKDDGEMTPDDAAMHAERQSYPWTRVTTFWCTTRVVTQVKPGRYRLGIDMQGSPECLEDELPYGVLFRAPLGRMILGSTRLILFNLI